MRKFMTILAVVAALPVTAALADDDCFVPMADWKPREAVEELAIANGWQVNRIRIDDGCYEIAGKDGMGRDIEVKVHPGTLQVVAIEYEDDDDEHGEEHHDD